MIYFKFYKIRNDDLLAVQLIQRKCKLINYAYLSPSIVVGTNQRD
jgi:hypothetical protein